MDKHRVEERKEKDYDEKNLEKKGRERGRNVISERWRKLGRRGTYEQDEKNGRVAG